MDDVERELKDEETVAAVAHAIDEIAMDVIRNAATYPKTLHDLPRIATSMEKAIKRGNLDDARMRATHIEKNIELYAPTDPAAQEAKFTLRHRVRLLTKSEE